MAIEQLVVNGCSYMELYSKGGGHDDLARCLGLTHSVGMALGGSCNSRILRSTLKHSYQTPYASLYVIGLTFLHRWELTVAQPVEIVSVNLPPGEKPWQVPCEGRWVNPQSSHAFERVPHWSVEDTAEWSHLMFKSSIDSEFDYLEDLVYRLVAVEADLKRRGHRMLCFNTVNPLSMVTVAQWELLGAVIDTPSIIGQLRWQSNRWQRAQGAAWHQYQTGTPEPPDEYRHIAEGEHRFLNQFLAEYIKNRAILSL